MLAQIVSPILGTFLISLALINFSANINPKLHLVLNGQLRQMQETFAIDSLKQIPFELLRLIFSGFLLVSGCILYFFQGFRRLLILIPLLIVSVLMFQSAVVFGSTLSNIPIYMFLLVSIIIILFHDCSQLDDLEIK